MQSGVNESPGISAAARRPSSERPPNHRNLPGVIAVVRGQLPQHSASRLSARSMARVMAINLAIQIGWARSLQAPPFHFVEKRQIVSCHSGPIPPHPPALRPPESFRNYVLDMAAFRREHGASHSPSNSSCETESARWSEEIRNLHPASSAETSSTHAMGSA